jgi:hypothetical protein
VNRPIRAIPTVYRGIRFRSRLAARWAIFFDTAGIRWVSEPQPFSDGETAYLPDFWLPDQGCYFEVQPDRNYDFDTPWLAVDATGRPLVIAEGPVSFSETSEVQPTGKELLQTSCACFVPHALMLKYFPEGWSLRELGCPPGDQAEWHYWQVDFYWAHCEICGRFDVSYDGWDRRFWCCGALSASSHTDRLHDAYRAAQTYRFWEPAS